MQRMPTDISLRTHLDHLGHSLGHSLGRHARRLAAPLLGLLAALGSGPAAAQTPTPSFSMLGYLQELSLARLRARGITVGAPTAASGPSRSAQSSLGTSSTGMPWSRTIRVALRPTRRWARRAAAWRWPTCHARPLPSRRR